MTLVNVCVTNADYVDITAITSGIMITKSAWSIFYLQKCKYLTKTKTVNELLFFRAILLLVETRVNNNTVFLLLARAKKYHELRIKIKNHFDKHYNIIVTLELRKLLMSLFLW